MRRVLTEDSNCLDVGAHSGSILRVMLSIAGHGRHMAFEPLPHLAAQLRLEFPQVQIHEVALSDALGETTFEYVVMQGWLAGAWPFTRPAFIDQCKRDFYFLAHP